MQNVAVIDEATHVGILKSISERLGKWIERVTNAVSPGAATLRLDRPKLDDFEKLELIGKGTYGRVRV